MRQKILNLINQFDWNPEINNNQINKNYDKVVVCGMGGSHLAADILQSLNLKEIIVWSDYNLPDLNLKNALIVVDSYSGNTEEALSSFREAKKRKLNICVITSGGKLLELAIKNNISYIQIPKSDLQPRMALIYQILALLKILNKKDILKEIKNLKNKINILNLEKEGKILAQNMFNFIPVIYASCQNKALAYIFKIKLNESSKIPAFYNTFPELNHNEMQGFNLSPKTKKILSNFLFIFLNDKNDNIYIKKRMKITSDLYKKQGFKILNIELNYNNFWLKVFNFLFLTDWISYYLSQIYNYEFENVPLIEEFKLRMK